MTDGSGLTPGPGRGPHPTTVPGFDRARELGLLPQVPAEPPRPVVINSRRVLVAFLAPVGLGFAAVIWAGSRDLPGLWMLAVALVPFLALLGAVIVPSRLEMREYAAGYCRADSHVGISVIDWKLRFQNQAGPAGAEWDLRGLWRLDAQDQVARPPDRTILPPGHYPSPEHPGKLEYWTGRDWMYLVREPDIPFV